MITQFLTHWSTHDELATLLYGAQMHQAPTLSPLEQRELRAQVGAALKVEELWNGHLRDAVETGASHLNVGVLACDDLCPVGTWLHRTLPARLKSTPLFMTTQERHAAFHDHAARLLALASEDTTAARHAFRSGSEFGTATLLLRQALRDWLALCGVSAHDETVPV